MSYVSKYRTAEQWDGFTNAKIDEIVEHILPLLPPGSDPMKVKTFDLMVYVIEDEVPNRHMVAVQTIRIYAQTVIFQMFVRLHLMTSSVKGRRDRGKSSIRNYWRQIIDA